MIKSKKPAKKVPTVKPVTEYNLMVAYPDNLYIMSKVEFAVGQRADDSGQSWLTGERQLSFSFYTYAEAMTAAKRAKKVNPKVTTSITVWGD